MILNFDERTFAVKEDGTRRIWSIRSMLKIQGCQQEGAAVDMIELVLRKCCPTFWACCSASREYVEDSNKHYVVLAKFNQEVEISLCTVAWLTDG